MGHRPCRSIPMPKHQQHRGHHALRPLQHCLAEHLHRTLVHDNASAAANPNTCAGRMMQRQQPRGLRTQTENLLSQRASGIQDLPQIGQVRKQPDHDEQYHSVIQARGGNFFQVMTNP